MHESSIQGNQDQALQGPRCALNLIFDLQLKNRRVLGTSTFQAGGLWAGT